MESNQEITLNRDTPAVRIPSGDKVASEQGLARISDIDADALGIQLSQSSSIDIKPAFDGDVDADKVWDQLKNVYDPEIPVNIVDLGLVYDCQILKTDDSKTKVEIKMTLTAPGCGMGPTIAEDARSRVVTVPGVDEAEVILVWDPPWNQHMISEVGKMKLGMI